jgi:hypothetical protein
MDGWSAPSHIGEEDPEAGRWPQTKASDWIMKCKSVEINELESLQLDGFPVDRMNARLDDLRTELEALVADGRFRGRQMREEGESRNGDRRG